MTRLSLLLVVACVLAAQSLSSQTHSAEVVHFDSEAAQTNAASGETASRLSIWGHLSVPEGDGPFPAILLMHGCVGVQPNHFRWAKILNDEGYVTLIADSYNPRSVINRCTMDAGPEQHIDRSLDAMGALTYLRNRDDVDADRIGIIGWSHGATMTLETVSRRGLAHGRDPTFSIAMTFFPFCMPDRRFDLPVLILIGEADDWSPASRCRDLAGQNEASGMITLVTYPRVFHAFDLMEVAEGFAAQGPNQMQYWVKYDPQAHQDAILRVRAFLTEHMPTP